MTSREHAPEADPAGHPPSAGRARLRGRLAAVGALILAFGFLSGLLLLIADDPIGFPLAFVSVFAIAFFGWFFVTTRGYRRLLGLPAVLLALVFLFTWAFHHKVALPVLIGVLALSALRPDMRCVTPARRCMWRAGMRAPQSQHKGAC